MTKRTTSILVAGGHGARGGDRASGARCRLGPSDAARATAPAAQRPPARGRRGRGPRRRLPRRRGEGGRRARGPPRARARRGGTAGPARRAARRDRLRRAARGARRGAAHVAEAEAESRLAEANLARRRKLAEERIVAANDLDAANRDVETSRARGETARATVTRYEALLAKSRIVAPIAGTVVARKVDAGQMVEAGDHAFTVADLGRLRVEGEAHEADAGADRARRGGHDRGRRLPRPVVARPRRGDPRLRDPAPPQAAGPEPADRRARPRGEGGVRRAGAAQARARRWTCASPRRAAEVGDGTRPRRRGAGPSGGPGRPSLGSALPFLLATPARERRAAARCSAGRGLLDGRARVAPRAHLGRPRDVLRAPGRASRSSPTPSSPSARARSRSRARGGSCRPACRSRRCPGSTSRCCPTTTTTTRTCPRSAASPRAACPSWCRLASASWCAAPAAGWPRSSRGGRVPPSPARR